MEMVLLFGLLVWGAILYNGLVRERNQVRAAWSDIDVQLGLRHDLIPRLVEVVRGYAAYERATLERVTALRDASAAVVEVGRKSELEESLTTQVKQLFAVVEAYPDLKANEQFLQLQKQLAAVEDNIQFARRFYNGAVRNFNTRIESFPDLIVARLFRYRPAEYFEFEPTGAA